jgi:D-alanyl-D-alanine dipeptidase
MERSHALMGAIMRHLLNESGEPLGSIPDAMREASVEVQFSTTKIAGQYERLFVIRRSLLPDLVTIAREMNARGWVLKIEDGYRTKAMQTALGRTPAVFDRIVRSCIRECGGRRPPVELVARRAMVLVANIPFTGTHMCGAAVDISVFRRDDGSEVWRGKPYLEMSEYTPMDCPFVSPEEHENRMAITRVMERHGFMHYPGEFWHYNKGDCLYQIEAQTGQPGIYGPVHWDPATDQVTPYGDPFAPLTPADMLGQMIEESLQRIG